MFSPRSTLFSLFSLLALFNALALAAPMHNLKLSTNAHHGAIAKRFDDARFTYYDAGQNACGSTDSNTAYVLALSPEYFNNGEHCFRSVTVQYNGKQVQATVTDECPGCKGDQADLSRPLFQALSSLDKGVIYGQWWYD